MQVKRFAKNFTERKQYLFVNSLTKKYGIYVNHKYIDILKSKISILVLIASQLYKPNIKIAELITLHNNSKVIQIYMKNNEYLDEVKKIDINNPLMFLYARRKAIAIYTYRINDEYVVFQIKQNNKILDYNDGLNLIKKFLNLESLFDDSSWLSSDIKEFCFGLINYYIPNDSTYLYYSYDISFRFIINKMYYYKAE